jgi:hypothetical protein
MELFLNHLRFVHLALITQRSSSFLNLQHSLLLRIFPLTELAAYLAIALEITLLSTLMLMFIRHAL